MIRKLSHNPVTGIRAPGFYVLSDRKKYNKSRKKWLYRNLGRYDTIEKAQERLKQIEAFKHMLKVKKFKKPHLRKGKVVKAHMQAYSRVSRCEDCTRIAKRLYMGKCNKCWMGKRKPVKRFTMRRA